MNKDLESLQDDVGGKETRLLSEEDKKEMRNSSWKSDPEEYGRPMTLEEAKRLSDICSKVSPSDFDSDEEFFDVIRQIKTDWQNVKVLFDGVIDEYGYIDTVYVFYSDETETSERTSRGFKEYMTVSFRSQLSIQTEENHGICPLCQDGISVKKIRDGTVIRDDDEELAARPQEFDFREKDDWGSFVRLWWDD